MPRGTSAPSPQTPPPPPSPPQRRLEKSDATCEPCHVPSSVHQGLESLRPCTSVEERLQHSALQAQRVLEASLCGEKKKECARWLSVLPRATEAEQLSPELYALRQTEAELRYTPRVEVDNYFRASLRGTDRAADTPRRHLPTSLGHPSSKERQSPRCGSRAEPGSPLGWTASTGPSSPRTVTGIESPAQPTLPSRKSPRSAQGAEAAAHHEPGGAQRSEGHGRNQNNGHVAMPLRSSPSGGRTEVQSPKRMATSTTAPPFRF